MRAKRGNCRKKEEEKEGRGREKGRGREAGSGRGRGGKTGTWRRGGRRGKDGNIAIQGGRERRKRGEGKKKELSRGTQRGVVGIVSKSDLHSTEERVYGVD